MNQQKDVLLDISDELKAAMEGKGIREDDLKRVVTTAEDTGVKLRNAEGNRFLAKLKLGEVYYCAEYERAGDGFRILEAYVHKTYVTGW